VNIRSHRGGSRNGRGGVYRKLQAKFSIPEDEMGETITTRMLQGHLQLGFTIYEGKIADRVAKEKSHEQSPKILLEFPVNKNKEGKIKMLGRGLEKGVTSQRKILGVILEVGSGEKLDRER